MSAPHSDLYYFNENGLLVFTQKYHLERGYCCKNGCRHCPYKKEKSQVEELKNQTVQSGKEDL